MTIADSESELAISRRSTLGAVLGNDLKLKLAVTPLPVLACGDGKPAPAPGPVTQSVLSEHHDGDATINLNLRLQVQVSEHNSSRGKKHAQPEELTVEELKAKLKAAKVCCSALEVDSVIPKALPTAAS